MTAIKEKQLGATATGTTAFSIEQDALLNTLLLCAKVVPKTSTIPLLTCIKFQLQGDTLFVFAMDPSQSVLQMLKVTNEKGVNGSYLVSAKEGIELVKRLPHCELSFIQRDSTVTITYGDRGKADLKVLDASEFPALPQLGESNFISAPIEMLRKGALASRYILQDETLPKLSCVNIFNENGRLAFKATDRHRIYRYISDIAIEEQEKFKSAMIPAFQFKGIVDSLKAQKVELAINGHYMVLRETNTVYFGRLMDGEYPDIDHIFKKTKEGTALQVSRSELDDTLNRMLTLDGVENNRVTMEVDEQGEFTMQSQSQTGEICESFPSSKVDDGFPTVKINGRYLRDALLVGDRDVKNVSLRTTGKGVPCFIEFDGDASVCVVVNQVR
jgi:DNA polymerase III subunit beta